MPTAGVLGAGAILQLSISSVLTSIVGVTSIGGPKMDCQQVDVTVLLSPAMWKEFISAFKDGGVVTCEANWTSGAYNTLFGHLGTTGDVWRITFSQGSHIDFTGNLQSLGSENPLETQVTMPLEIKITGAPTFTP